jgi:5-amino-6-(5-phosphoribosylamino)uracil reductase
MALDRPYVLLSAAISLDGYLNDTSRRRLILSSPQDLQAVKRLRGEYDAILVGGRTIREDDPSLLAIDGPDPLKIALTSHGRLDPHARFFTTGEVGKLVWCRPAAVESCRQRLGKLARIAPLDGFEALPAALKILAAQGVQRLLVEGGGRVHTEFLTRGLADGLRLAVAPFFVGDPEAPRLVDDGRFPQHAGNRARLTDVQQFGDTAVMRYAFGD